MRKNIQCLRSLDSPDADSGSRDGRPGDDDSGTLSGGVWDEVWTQEEEINGWSLCYLSMEGKEEVMLFLLDTNVDISHDSVDGSFHQPNEKVTVSHDVTTQWKLRSLCM